MKKYGSKDIMRMESIREKAYGDYMSQLNYAFNMATAITEPGKALARGYAAREVFGENSAVAAIFFERGYDLGGKDVKPVASVNAFDENADNEFEGIPINEQPASRRSLNIGQTTKKRTPWANIVALGKMNLIKGSGPQFNLYNYPLGIIEVWNEAGKPRIIYTSSNESVYQIGETRKFKYSNKIVEWEMVDFIESEFVSNLAPLYGKSIMIFNYD